MPADILCPLCTYNLCGLAEPRCPECGYRFEWAEILNADQRKHPYLFEEHPERNVRSLFRTLLGGLTPGRFWASLKPSHAPVPRRLAIYWGLTSSILLLGWAAYFVGALMVAEEGIQADRVKYVQNGLRSYPVLPTGPDPSWVASLSKQAEHNYPSAFSPKGAGDILSRGDMGTITHTTLLCFLWPAATFATLIIFKDSMRNAKVRGIHVARCAIYSSDAGIWLGLPLALLFTVSSFASFEGTNGFERGTLAPMILATILALIAAYRLSKAYRLYLKFDHPRTTAAASQLIVLLLAYALAFDLPMRL